MGRAMAAGIPVICLERDITQPNYSTFVGADNLAIGEMAGQLIVEELTKRKGNPAGNVVELRGLLGVEAEMETLSRGTRRLENLPEHSLRSRGSSGLASEQWPRSHAGDSASRTENRCRLRT